MKHMKNKERIKKTKLFIEDLEDSLQNKNLSEEDKILIEREIKKRRASF